MRSAVRATGEWCTPTAELPKSQLARLLHAVRASEDEGAIPEPLPEHGSDALTHPWFEDSVVELVEEPPEPPRVAPLELAPPPVLARGSAPKIEPVYPVYPAKPSIVRSVLAIFVVLGAGVGGVFAAMTLA